MLLDVPGKYLQVLNMEPDREVQDLFPSEGTGSLSGSMIVGGKKDAHVNVKTKQAGPVAEPASDRNTNGNPSLRAPNQSLRIESQWSVQTLIHGGHSKKTICSAKPCRPGWFPYTEALLIPFFGFFFFRLEAESRLRPKSLLLQPQMG